MNAIAQRSVNFTDAGIEAMKWLALACMLVDHVNAVFFDRSLGLLADVLGRQAFPLFAIVLGYNLARPAADTAGLLQRLLLVGAIAEPAHWFLFGQIGAWPLNVLFTFAVAVWALQLWQDGREPWAAAVFALGGALVEYWWPGLLLVGAVYLWRRLGHNAGLLAVLAAVAALQVVNGNALALLALPVAFVLGQGVQAFPRVRWAFWVAYPAHLYVLAIAAECSKYGII